MGKLYSEALNASLSRKYPYMNLYFEDRFGVYTKLSDMASESNMMGLIHEKCDKHNYKIPYIHAWVDDRGMVVDVGSWNEFFILTEKELENE